MWYCNIHCDTRNIPWYLSIKYSSSKVLITSSNKSLLEELVFGFLRKDFIYSKYKNTSKISKYKTNYKLSKINLSLLNSLNFLKELVSEPSNIIYPNSFVKIMNNFVINDNKQKVIRCSYSKEFNFEEFSNEYYLNLEKKAIKDIFDVF